jgi:hypothetical protein
MRITGYRARNDAVSAMSEHLVLRCTAWSAQHPAGLLYRCPVCEGILEVERKKPEARSWQRADGIDMSGWRPFGNVILAGV